MSLRRMRWPEGTPCWIELGTPDPDSSRKFYNAVLGWTYSEVRPEYGNYAVAQIRGGNAAGIGSLQDEAPGEWVLFFASDDIDKTSSLIKDANGDILVGRTEVGRLGQLVIAVDPTGAAFGVWEAGDRIGAEVYNEPGALHWDDLRSVDPDAARSFYEAVFGFRYDPIPEGEPDYTTFSFPAEEAPLGGIGGMMGLEGTSRWIIYFGVNDIDASLKATRENGGVIVAEDFETSYGRMAAIKDPGGADLWLIQPK